MRCQKDRSNKALKSKEAICSMYGTLYDVEIATQKFIERMTDYYESIGESYEEISLALLIPQ